MNDYDIKLLDYSSKLWGEYKENYNSLLDEIKY